MTKSELKKVAAVFIRYTNDSHDSRYSGEKQEQYKMGAIAVADVVAALCGITHCAAVDKLWAALED